MLGRVYALKQISLTNNGAHTSAEIAISITVCVVALSKFDVGQYRNKLIFSLNKYGLSIQQRRPSGFLAMKNEPCHDSVQQNVQETKHRHVWMPVLYKNF